MSTEDVIAHEAVGNSDEHIEEIDLTGEDRPVIDAGPRPDRIFVDRLSLVYRRRDGSPWAFIYAECQGPRQRSDGRRHGYSVHRRHYNGTPGSELGTTITPEWLTALAAKYLPDSCPTATVQTM